jgi:DNA repair exonuclease SbcCD ATPase subunit
MGTVGVAGLRRIPEPLISHHRNRCPLALADTPYPASSMDKPGDHEVLSELDQLREALQAGVSELSKQRQELEAQREELEEKLEGVDTELEAKQRMLRLVEATAQELAQEPQSLDESGPQHVSVEASTEVRRRSMAELASLA